MGNGCRADSRRRQEIRCRRCLSCSKTLFAAECGWPLNATGEVEKRLTRLVGAQAFQLIFDDSPPRQTGDTGLLLKPLSQICRQSYGDCVTQGEICETMEISRQNKFAKWKGQVGRQLAIAPLPMAATGRSLREKTLENEPGDLAIELRPRLRFSLRRCSASFPPRSSRSEAVSKMFSPIPPKRKQCLKPSENHSTLASHLLIS